VSVADVERLGPAEAVSIYHKKFWLSAWCDALPVGVDLLTFDAAVNMGVEPALNFVRQQVGMASSMRDAHHVFHRMESHLAQAAKAVLARRVEQGCRPAVIAGICEQRREYYRTRPHFATFGKGWMARMAAVESLGMHLWAADPPGPA
jgi:lysozyme family protein